MWFFFLKETPRFGLTAKQMQFQMERFPFPRWTLAACTAFEPPCSFSFSFGFIVRLPSQQWCEGVTTTCLFRMRKSPRSEWDGIQGFPPLSERIPLKAEESATSWALALANGHSPRNLPTREIFYKPVHFTDDVWTWPFGKGSRVPPSIYPMQFKAKTWLFFSFFG